MVACSIISCKNRSETVRGMNIKFFSFPKNLEIAKKWMQACGKEVNLQTARVCSSHFIRDDFKDKPEYYGNFSPKTVRTLLPDVVPTVNLNPENNFNAISNNKKKENVIIENGGTEAEEFINIDAANETLNYQTPKSKTSEIIPDNELSELKKQLAHEKKKNLVLTKQIKRLQRKSQEEVKNKVQNILKSIFTPKQIAKLMNPQQKRVKWGVEDIASAIALKSISPKAYRFLQKNNYSLPGLSILRKWALCSNLDESVFLKGEKMMDMKRN